MEDPTSHATSTSLSTSLSPSPSSDERPRARRLLYWWPMTLAALTAALLFVAGRVSAWHRDHPGGADAVRAHAVRIVDRLLEDLDASEPQAARVRVLTAEILDQLEAARAQHGDDRSAWRDLVTADMLDAAALESLRRDHVAQADALSNEILVRLTAILEVLSPEQRRALVERFEEFHGFRRALHRSPRHTGFLRHSDPTGLG